MILFIDHHAQGLTPIHHHATADALGGVFAADQVSLHQNLFLQRSQILQQFRERILHLRQLLDPRHDELENCGAISLLRPARKRTIPHIAREPYPAAHHDLVMGAFAAQPFARAR